MRAVWVLALKDLRLFVRDRLSLFWVLAFPLLLALFFGSLFGGGEGRRGTMKVCVADESGGEASAFLDRLRGSGGIEIDLAPSLPQARDLVRRGERVAFLHVREGFTDGGFAMFGRDPDAPPWLALGVDPSRTAERGLLQGLVSQALFSGMAEQISDPVKMRAQTQQVRAALAEATDLDTAQREDLVALMDALDRVSAAPGEEAERGGEGASGFSMSTAGLLEAVDVDPDRAGRPRSPFEVTFPASVVWGLMGCATAFATTMVRERRAGTLLRLRVSPLSRAQVLAGKGLACTLAGLGASALLLAFAVLALGVRIGDPLLLLVALVGASACFTGVMMVLSVLGKTEAAVAGGSWVVMMPLAMIGGGMIPLVAMPRWLLAASDASPFKWAIYAIEGAVWRDFSAAELVAPVGILLGIAGGLFAIGVLVLRRGDPRAGRARDRG